MSQSLFSQPLNVINVGIAMFSDDLKKQHVEVTQLDWTPPGQGNMQVVQALDARTGRALFTTSLPAQAPRPRLGLRYPGGFVLGRDQTTYTLSPTGKLGPVLTYH